MNVPKRPAFQWNWGFSIGNIISIATVIMAVAASYFGMQQKIAVIDEQRRSDEVITTSSFKLAADERRRLEKRLSDFETNGVAATKERQGTVNRLIRLETLIEQQIRQGDQVIKAIERLDNKIETLDDRVNRPSPRRPQ